MFMAPKPLLVVALLTLAFVARTFWNGACNPSGQLRGNSTNCTMPNKSDCCVDGKMYPQYRCSPPVTGSTPATMYINDFPKDAEGGNPSACFSQFYDNDKPIVGLSTGWYDDGSRCLSYITIKANGRSVRAMVVDECNSVYGCDADNEFTPPCDNNIVNASPAVWKALNIPKSQIGEYKITWSDAGKGGGNHLYVSCMGTPDTTTL